MVTSAEIELIAYEAAFLERNGWRLLAGRWKDPEPPFKEYTRSIAVGLQAGRDARKRRTTEPRLPAIPPPPVVEPPKPSAGKTTVPMPIVTLEPVLEKSRTLPEGEGGHGGDPRGE